MRTTAFPYIQAREIDYLAQAAATIESRTSNARHTLGDGDGGEAAATFESIVSNARHAFGYGDGGEAAAILESIWANANCPFFYFYARVRGHCSFIFIKNLAYIYYPIGLIVIPCCAIESRVSNTRHTLGDGDGGEAAAILEYIKH